MANKYITPELFKFFADLKKNNNKEWFDKNKPRFEGVVREPLLQFIRDFEPHLEDISRHFVADDRKSGGSLFRIYRDTRFSKNKDPYKTNAGIHFRHKRAKDAHAPGFYLHLDRGDVFMGGGIWCPQAKVAQTVREAIDADQRGWLAAKNHKPFKKNWELVQSDMLKRPPRGFDKEHPLMEDLRLKQFIAIARSSEEEACSTGFLKKFKKRCEEAAPFCKFITKAFGEKW